MTNVFEEIGHGVKEAAVDVAKGAAWPFEHFAQLIKALDVAMVDTPKAKEAIIGLIQQIELLSSETMIAVATKGLNIPDDIQAVIQLKAFVTYVRDTFLPQVESIVSDVKDIEAAAAPADPAPADPAPVIDPNPGLHNVVPA